MTIVLRTMQMTGSDIALLGGALHIKSRNHISQCHHTSWYLIVIYNKQPCQHESQKKIEGMKHSTKEKLRKTKKEGVV